MMRKCVTAAAALLAGALLAGCESIEKPNIRVEPPATARARGQTTDLAGYVVDMIATKTRENNKPDGVDSVLFDNTQDPHAFDSLFEE